VCDAGGTSRCPPGVIVCASCPRSSAHRVSVFSLSLHREPRTSRPSTRPDPERPYTDTTKVIATRKAGLDPFVAHRRRPVPAPGYQHGRLMAEENCEVRRYARARPLREKTRRKAGARSGLLSNALFLRKRWTASFLEEMKGIADGAAARRGARKFKQPQDRPSRRDRGSTCGRKSTRSTRRWATIADRPSKRVKFTVPAAR